MGCAHQYGADPVGTDGGVAHPTGAASKLLAGLELGVQGVHIIASGAEQDVQGDVGEAELGGTLVVAVMIVVPLQKLEQ